MLIESDEAGLCLVHDRRLRHVYMFNHLEYDSTTLDAEYRRDLAKGEPIGLPRHYYPGDEYVDWVAGYWERVGELPVQSRVAPGEIDRLAVGANLIPGMPVEAYIRTRDRSPLARAISISSCE